MVIGNNITNENLIIVKELINNWQIASTSRKKKKKLKNTGQLDPTCNPTQPATRLTRNPIDPFKNDPFWPATRFDPRPDWPDPPVLPCLVISAHNLTLLAYPKILTYSRTYWVIPVSTLIPNLFNKVFGKLFFFFFWGTWETLFKIFNSRRHLQKLGSKTHQLH